MRAIADAAIDAWPQGEAFPVYESMQRVSLDVIFRVVFGFRPEDESTELEEALLDATTRPAPILFFPKLHFKRFGPFKRLIDRIAHVDVGLHAQIARRRAAPDCAERHDILSTLLQARDESGVPLTDTEIRDQLITMLIAGYETTAATLAWTLYLVLGDPRVYAKLRAELDRVMEGGPLRLERLESLEYLEATLKEVLRIYPVLPSLARMLTAPMRVGEYDLPAGVIVMPCSWLTHRREDLYPEPESFRPERFLEGKPTPYEYYPFGGGARRCIGMAFATYEARVVLAEILLRAPLRLEPGHVETVKRKSTILAPSGGTRVIMDGPARPVRPAPGAAPTNPGSVRSAPSACPHIAGAG
jgi:cytochrome P450